MAAFRWHVQLKSHEGNELSSEACGAWCMQDMSLEDQEDACADDGCSS